jgi:hypothetical protein
MKTITKTTTATTEKGTALNLTITVKRGWEKVTEHLYNDGWESDVEKMKEIRETTTTIEANGQKFTGEFSTGMFVPAEYKKQGVFAIFANKIGLSERVYNELNSICEEAKKEAETDDSWIALQAKKEQAKKEEEEYYKNSKAVENMMTLNGKTY